MNMELIGIFISQLRKEKNLSQEKLGDILGVTNKTISRWETGKYLPPADMLLVMSELFGVSINEILSGRRLTQDEYREVAEKNLVQAIKSSSFTLKDKMDFYKKKWLKEHIFFMSAMGLILVAVLITGVLLKIYWLFGLFPILFVIFHCVRNNAMMAYVERNAFDGTNV